MKLTVATNIPTPYRNPVYDRIADKLGDDFTVVYCAEKEANRSWDIADCRHNQIFLKENYMERSNTSFVHNNPDIWKVLRDLNSDLVITNGFYPTQLYAWMYTVRHRKKHGILLDGWKYTESELSLAHKVARKTVFQTTAVFIGPGKKTAELYKSYGAKDEQIFQSHLCANDLLFNKVKPFEEREYDVMFAGQFHERKLPFFFIDVVKEMKKSLPAIKVLLIGGGPLQQEMLDQLKAANIDYHYPGFVQPQFVAEYFGNSKLFLFTTKLDPWGVVANEALASGAPVITTPYAGVADDLVVEDETGYVIEPVVEFWAAKSLQMLNNRALWERLSLAGRKTLDVFNYDNAAQGILDAAEYALSAKRNAHV